jgi:hypothetical protein
MQAKRSSPLGPHPMGVAIIDAERIIAMAGDDRAALPPEVKRASAAYCGRYIFDGTKAVTSVDGASSPEMMDDQVRHIRFEGSRQMVVVPVSRLFGRGWPGARGSAAAKLRYGSAR